ncbi:spindle pole body-associated sad1 [Fusarium longipes]|uniref:Spindle pole body-associated sad1 n=1 Tax=Fusarium longipes TaxID=694270 RepID=A0A395RJB8_9HYPO|nr:spindle pole body-associated sad1 [Fusarium longipes]
MPPKPTRRSTRYASREPDSERTGGVQTTLVRPQLPHLQGTPSRRQYAYGSAVEPAPRVGAGLKSMHLSDAIAGALRNKEGAEEFARPTEPRSTAGNAARDTRAPRQATTSATGHLAVGRDDDSSRSFGLESDLYDQAEIQAEIQATQDSLLPPPEGRAPRASTQQVEDPDDTPPVVRRKVQLRQTSHEANETESRTRTERVTGSRPANTPAPERTRQNTNRSQVRRQSVSSDDFESDNRKPSRTYHNGVIQSEPFPWPEDEDALNRARQIPSERQRLEEEIEREIAAATDDASYMRAMRRRYQFLGAPRPVKAWLYVPYDWLVSIWQYMFPNQDEHHRNLFVDEVVGTDGPTEWRRLLYPMTYVRTLKWAFDNIIDYIIDLVDRLSGLQIRQLQTSAAERLLWILALGGFALFLLVSSGGLRYVPSIPTFPDIGSLKPSDMHWPSTDSFRFGNIIPSVSWPSMSWPSGGKDDDDDFSFYDPFPADDIVIPDDHKMALDALKNQAEIHKKSLKRLETILPRIVQMDLVNGRPSIKPEFWHALKEHLKEDGSFLNLEKKNGNYEISSEKQWRAIVARLEKDPTFRVKLDTVADRSIENKLPSFWDTWFKNNNDVLEPFVEKALAKKQAAGSGAAFDRELSKIVGEELRKQNQTAVSRDEFLTHLRNDFAKHESEIEAEFTRLKSYMDEHIKESIRNAKMMAPQAISETEMRQLIRKIIYQTLTDGSLEAVAKSKIHAHWNTNLKYQVNYFGTGAGATIDTIFATPNWEPYKSPEFTDKQASALGIEGIILRHPIEALRPWQDEGDRWCGAHGTDKQGRTHGVGLSVRLGHTVIPENIVVEHIHPNSSTDPDARPRHIEVFARFDFKEDQEHVRDYSSIKFPENINGWNFNPAPLPTSFVKITQFEYQADELNEGVHVHHINDEFSNLGIATDHVIIRALSNYGAPDHTCFYRVRLFGQRVDE